MRRLTALDDSRTISRGPNEPGRGCTAASSRVLPGTFGAAVLSAALLAFAASAQAHPFKWDGSAPDPSRPGVTIRWDRTLSSCGDTSPFRTLKVRVHQGQTPIRSDEYLVVIGRRQLRRDGKWLTLPAASDGVVKRGKNGKAPTHLTLRFYLRYVDKGMRSRVRLRYLWKRAAGEPGDADDTVFAKRRAYTSACKIP